MHAWIKMSLGTEVGLGPGDIVFRGDPAPPLPKGSQTPNFQLISVAAKWLHGMELGLGPGDFLLDGDLVAPSPKGGDPQIFGRPMFIVTKRLDG